MLTIEISRSYPEPATSPSNLLQKRGLAGITTERGFLVGNPRQVKLSFPTRPRRPRSAPRSALVGKGRARRLDQRYPVREDLSRSGPTVVPVDENGTFHSPAGKIRLSGFVGVCYEPTTADCWWEASSAIRSRPAVDDSLSGNFVLSLTEVIYRR